MKKSKAKMWCGILSPLWFVLGSPLWFVTGLLASYSSHSYDSMFTDYFNVSDSQPSHKPENLTKRTRIPANNAGERKTRFRLFPMIQRQRGRRLRRQAYLLSHSFIETPGNMLDPAAPSYGTYRWLSHSNRVIPANPVWTITPPAK